MAGAGRDASVALRRGRGKAVCARGANRAASALRSDPPSGPMRAAYSPAFVERLFLERDFDGLHQVISAVEQERALPEEFWLFCRVFEWAPSRSGVWQYYEAIPEATFNRVLACLEKYRMSEIASKYAVGRNCRGPSESLAALDNWLNDNAASIHTTVFLLIDKQRGLLTNGA
jgi:hypothetical protein